MVFLFHLKDFLLKKIISGSQTVDKANKVLPHTTTKNVKVLPGYCAIYRKIINKYEMCKIATFSRVFKENQLMRILQTALYLKSIPYLPEMTID